MPDSGTNGSGSGPGGQNGFRFHDLFGGTGEGEFELAGAAGDQDFDGVQAVVLHREAELFGDFAGSVLLEAIVHAVTSAPGAQIAMFNAVYLGRHGGGLRRWRPGAGAGMAGGE